MHKLIIITLLLFANNQLFAQQSIVKDSTNLAVLRSFINDLSNPEIATDIILSQHIIVDHPDDDLYDYLEASLDEIRINLSTKNLEDIQYIPYSKLPKKEVSDIDLEGNLPEQIYFLKYLNRTLTSILIHKDKIASFTLVSKGNKKAHFVTY